jgi:hypothetical protein
MHKAFKLILLMSKYFSNTISTVHFSYLAKIQTS